MVYLYSEKIIKRNTDKNRPILPKDLYKNKNLSMTGKVCLECPRSASENKLKIYIVCLKFSLLVYSFIVYKVKVLYIINIGI